MGEHDCLTAYDEERLKKIFDAMADMALDNNWAGETRARAALAAAETAEAMLKIQEMRETGVR